MPVLVRACQRLTLIDGERLLPPDPILVCFRVVAIKPILRPSYSLSTERRLHGTYDYRRDASVHYAAAPLADRSSM